MIFLANKNNVQKLNTKIRENSSKRNSELVFEYNGEQLSLFILFLYFIDFDLRTKVEEPEECLFKRLT